MPRRKRVRTAEEEVEFQRIRRERNAEYQRQYRKRNAVRKENQTVEPVENIEDVEGTDVRLRNTHREQQARYRSGQRGIVDQRIVHNEFNNVTEHYIGKMDVTCNHCGAKHFQAEKPCNTNNSFNDCCNHGKVQLDPLPDPPTELRALFDGSDMKSKLFYERIRSYNSAFSFASFNTNLVDFSGSRRAPYCFKIQGQIYYQINTAIYPSPNEQPNYGQLFIVDMNEAVQYRLNYDPVLNSDILRTLDSMMRTNNVFAQSFEMMGEELRLQQNRVMESEENVPNELHLLFTLKPGVDQRRFNFQRCNEVAAVFSTTADGEIPESYVVVRGKNNRELQTVSTMDPNVEPWVYPLLYPHGTQGWHRNLFLKDSEKRITRCAYTKYRIAIRDDFNVIIMGRRLFQQWLVDSYVKIERDRMNYLLQNQKKLRVDNYVGLQDHLSTIGYDRDARLGKIIILPSSHVGSPRNMVQHYQDAMGIVRHFGKPDLFITMTCNPQWLEIQENLLPGQQAQDRPDICARVFNIKKDFLLDFIVRQKYFGKVQAFVYVIEFQKRGLPHIHLLVTLDCNSKMTTPSIVDRYICTEIPHPNEYPILHQVVMKQMIHGPCGDWCEVDGKCSKHYPKQFRDETTMDHDGYPFYRRRDTGETFERPGNYIVDNRHVVPYCPTLLLLLNCHINVEVVSSIKSVKYLFKYVYKGHDAAAIVINESVDNETVINYNEIHNYIETRYVGPVEAAWRILSKPLQEKSHTITRLPVHLPNEQNVIIPEEVDDNSLRSALEKVTMLMEYFALNARDVEARKYTYSDIPCHYVFKKVNVDGQNRFRWMLRKAQFNVIGRMYSISPSQIELFHLRLLLLTVKGATSFEHLRTVRGEVYPSFTATCLALGLIEDDGEWERAMQEGASWMMPQRLRRLFVRILIYCSPIHPEQLWEKFKIPLSEDYIRRSNITQGTSQAYSQINQMLNTEGWSLSQFPSMNQVVEDVTEEESVFPEQDVTRGISQYDKLNDQQRDIVDAVLKSVDNIGSPCTNENINCFYVDGPGGSGKTFIYTTLSHLLRTRGKNVCSMAFTGIAATLLPHGKTVHKTFGLPVPLFPDSTSNIKVQSKEGKYLKSIDVFIWDEAPMSPRYALEVMDRTLRDIMNNNTPFGGKIVVLGGDFRQLLPIKVHGTRAETINLSIKSSIIWRKFKIFSLTRNMRALPTEIEFAEFVLSVGNGDMNNHDDIEVPESIVAPPNANIVEDIYGRLIRNKLYRQTTTCAILSARNSDVDEINKRVVELLDINSEKIYTSVDTISEACDNRDISEAILPEYLNTLSPASLPAHELRLRVYTVVMLTRNLSINEGLCNGTRLLILEMGDNLLRCEILTGDKKGQIVFLNRITLYSENDYPFTFARRQFPIKLAFAMTINKSQGQTFEKIGIDLRKDVFNHGQLYVALSRVRSWDSLKIYLGNQRNTRIVKNYVYKEVFL